MTRNPYRFYAPDPGTEPDQAMRATAPAGPDVPRALNPDTIMTTGEGAALLGMHPKNVARACARGYLPNAWQQKEEYSRRTTWLFRYRDLMEYEQLREAYGRLPRER